MFDQQRSWPLAVALEQDYVTLTLSTVVVGCLVIFVTAFLLGLWCGWRWQQGRGGR
jgi:hypothetical protein